MSNFGILMLIFASMVLLIGFYMFRGHKVVGLAWKPQFKNATISDWKNIGKWTMIVSIFIYLIAIIGFIFNI